jgi:hypothetical protein
MDNTHAANATHVELTAKEIAQEQVDNVVADLSESIQLIKKEVDALQITVMSQKAPWYKSLPTTISLIALLFSFGTTYVSYTRIDAQDKQNMRAELRGLLQRLSSISRDSIELPKRYSDDPVAAGAISGMLNQENTLLSRQAAELARKLPKDLVSATEYCTIGAALQISYNFQGAKEFFVYAIESAKDFNDKISALRYNANLMFIMGQPESGRNEYRKALDIFLTFSDYDDFTKKSTNIQTELAWAYSESNLRLKDRANQHIANAESYVSSLAPGPGTTIIKGQIDQAKLQINSVGNPINPLAHP